MSWLSTEARQIHDLFSSMFYSIILFMIALGVVTNFFKMPMGQIPEFLHLIGRAILSAFILAAMPEIMNAMANVTDELAQSIGQLDNLHHVLSRLGDKIGTLTWSWVSVKDSVILLISYITYFFVYVSVYIADAMYLLTWTGLYIFSPLLIAAFTMPATAAATRGLFQSLIEVCLWKICWAVNAALLWSFALSQVNNPKYDIDFLTAIVLNLLLAFSVLLTPLMVRALLKGGMSTTASAMSGAVLSALALTPTQMLSAARSTGEASISKFTSDKDKASPQRKGLPKGVD